MAIPQVSTSVLQLPYTPLYIHQRFSATRPDANTSLVIRA
jgi:hypothetical protein